MIKMISSIISPRLNKKSPTKDAFFLFVPLALLLLFHLQADNPRETEKHN